MGRASLRALSRRDWGQLAVLGLAFYTATQGAQFLALERLPAVTLSLLLNFSVIVVVLAGPLLLSEWLTAIQWGGAGLFLLGVLVISTRSRCHRSGYRVDLRLERRPGERIRRYWAACEPKQRIPATTVTVSAWASAGVARHGDSRWHPPISPLNGCSSSGWR
jgi:multidrug transporter EmrE-like cation transporter